MANKAPAASAAEKAHGKKTHRHREAHTLGPKDLVQALKTESEALQKVHANLRANIQTLEAEEAVIKVMIRRELRRLRGQDGPAKARTPAGAASQDPGNSAEGHEPAGQDSEEE